MRASLLWTGGLVLLVALAGCSTSGMAFMVDDSIRVTAPEPRSTVSLPVTVRWLDASPPAVTRVAPADPEAEYYAVFVDRAPVRPGASVVDVIDDVDRRTCLAAPQCPDPKVLRDRGVLLTESTEVELEFLRDQRPASRATSKDPHEVAVVRMRGDRRTGEAAFRVSFFVRR